MVQGLKSSSLDGVLSKLRVACRETPERRLSPGDETRVKASIRALQKTAPATVAHIPGLTYEQLAGAIAAAEAEGTAHGRQAAAMFATLVGLQARGNEVLGREGIKFKDIEFVRVPRLVGGHGDAVAGDRQFTGHHRQYAGNWSGLPVATAVSSRSYRHRYR